MQISTPTRPPVRRGLTALCLAALAPLGAMAQPPTFEDTMAQRLLACTGCHGRGRRAASDGFYPRIAGKPAGYLFRQLRASGTGSGPTPDEQPAAPLDDAYLQEIANHFSTLEAALCRAAADPRRCRPTCARAKRWRSRGMRRATFPPARPATARHSPAWAPTCRGCWACRVDYLNAQLGAWRTGARRAEAPDCMAKIAQRLTRRT